MPQRLAPRSVSLLGVPIDAVTKGEALSLLLRLAREERSSHVATPNSEMLVESARNIPFRDVLRRTVLNLPDSAGLLWMAKCTGQRLPERVTGVDTMARLCDALTESDPVYLLGAWPGTAEKTAAALKARNPRLRIVGTHAGSPHERDAGNILDRIKQAKPTVLFVAYGAPAQELWIDRYLSMLPSVRVAMGVGGTFDFLAGVQVRAPVVFQKLGLEWLWRLFREPRRAKRIWNAVIVFPSLVLRYGKNAPRA